MPKLANILTQCIQHKNILIWYFLLKNDGRNILNLIVHNFREQITVCAVKTVQLTAHTV